MPPTTRIRHMGENPCVTRDATGDKCFQVWQWLSCWAARLGFVNRKSDVVWGERAASGWVPVSADGCPRVSDLPGLMREDAELTAAGRKSVLRVFVQYWNNTTAEGRGDAGCRFAGRRYGGRRYGFSSGGYPWFVREGRSRRAALGARQEGDFP